MIKTVVLAAGKGSRLKSKVPKVLHKVFDKPLLAWLFDSLAEVAQEEIIVIVGHKHKEVESFMHAYPVTTIIQEPQLGTGHAVQSAAGKLKDFDGTLLVVNGDCPLVKPETLNKLISHHEETNSQITLLTCKHENPNGYGRIITKNNQIIGIKEDKDCAESEKSIKEINVGIYCFDWQKIRAGLDRLSNNNAHEEYYLTDLVSWAYSQGLKISTLEINNQLEVLGVNERRDLAIVSQEKNKETLEYLMQNGVTIIDPNNTIITPEVEIGYDTVIFPGTYIHRSVTIGKNCTIGPNTTIFGPVEIGDNTEVIHSHISRSTIGNDCRIGPFAHIRDGNDIGNNVRLGNFVEVKNCEIAEGTHAAHLSYLGDSKIKSNVNIGAGTVTANFDSRTGEKNQTIIKAGASTGANSVLVAPVEIGERSLIAAGSVITEDVPDDSLAIARPKQEVKRILKKVTTIQ